MKRLISMAAILLLIFLAACNGDDSTTAEEEEERVVAVEVAEAKEDNLTVENTVYGRTAPNSTMPVIVQAPGEIEELEVENGDEIEEDDLIATIKTAAGNQNVRAATDGEIINLHVKEGNMATTEQPIAMVADLDSMKLQIAVTATVRSLFSVDKTMKVNIDGSEYEATVTQIDTLPDDTGLYPIALTVDNEEGDILPGVVAEVIVPEEKVESAIIVPTEAIVEENNESYVYVVNDNIAKKQVVTILETQSDVTAIEGELQAGDKIVKTGQLTLTDGIQVNVTGGE